ncbi:MAG: PleD family two-component system response regulator [Hyphomicrobiales bacterium]|nr:PleD family two-component system response regulator [Hyphomicrobiales bacterium]
MTARILVVDDLAANTKLLEVRLTAEYFEVIVANNGVDALQICRAGRCDIVLLDAMMPGIDGFEVCRRLKADRLTAHLPVIIITALDEARDRVRGLEAGADDFLTKPVDEMALLARVRSLTRLKVFMDELRSRAQASNKIGTLELLQLSADREALGGHILLVDDRPSSSERVAAALSEHHKIDTVAGITEAQHNLGAQDYDLVIVALSVRLFDPLRLCSQIRAMEKTRQTPILLIAETEDRARVLRGLEMGVNDYLMRPLDRNELRARVRTQLRRKYYTESLRESMQATIEMAVIDPLTGLNNRRYMESQLGSVLQKAETRRRPVSLMILDIDHFKRVNDTYGHGAGDDVLKGFAQRVRQVIRAVDLMCRLGGEEFVILMPDTDIDYAATIAERVRSSVEGSPFPVEGGRNLPITVSIGLADNSASAAPEEILKRADIALYRSKTNGRNQVTKAAA